MMHSSLVTMLTMTEETLEDSDLDSLTFVESAKIAKQQAKQKQTKRDTGKVRWKGYDSDEDS